MKMNQLLIYLLSCFILIVTNCQKNEEVFKEPTIPVKIMQVQPDSISSFLEITGNLEAINDAVVYSMISEKLNKINKNVGSRVKKDETIAVMENRIWQESLNQAAAALRSIEARHEQVKQDYDRYQRLFEENAVSQQQWEKIRSSMQEADASLAQLKAAYSTSQEQYQNTFIKAPFDGIVGSFMFDEGEMIQIGQPVAKIVNIDLMKAKLYIPDVHMNRIQPDQLVYGKFPALEEQKFTGRIRRIDPAIDPTSRTIQVEVSFSNEKRSLKSGMYGLFQIEISRRTNTLIVPDNSIITKTEVKINPETGATYTDKTYFIYIVKGDSAELVQVDTGIESYNRMEIISGLTEGDKVIIVGQKVVKPGNKVLIIKD